MGNKGFCRLLFDEDKDEDGGKEKQHYIDKSLKEKGCQCRDQNMYENEGENKLFVKINWKIDEVLTVVMLDSLQIYRVTNAFN